MRVFKSAIIFSFIAFACTVSNAEVILGVSSASTTLGSFGSNSIGNLANQSGLASGYTSGVTDFDDFTTNTTHNNDTGSRWLSSPSGASNLPGLITLDLGSSQSISRLAIWNTQGDAGIKDFNVFADSDLDFGNGTSGSLGSFSMSVAATSTISAQIFDIGDVATPFVHLQILNIHGTTIPFVGLNEVAFERGLTAVPEPGSFALFGVGVAGFGFFRRRKR